MLNLAWFAELINNSTTVAHHFPHVEGRPQRTILEIMNEEGWQMGKKKLDLLGVLEGASPLGHRTMCGLCCPSQPLSFLSRN